MAQVLRCGDKYGGGCSKFTYIDDEGNVTQGLTVRPPHRLCSAPARLKLCPDCFTQQETERAKFYLHQTS